MNQKTTILVASGAIILVCLCLCLLAFFVMSALPANNERIPPETVRQTAPERDEIFPLPGPDKPPAESVTQDIPAGGLGNDQLRADVWRDIFTISKCPGVSARDVSIYIDDDDPSLLAEYWLLYCPLDEVEIYHIRYEEVSDGVTYYISRLE
jgi:hypothetical protein